MRLWILRPVKDWDPWYDKAFGFVVRAADEKHARRIAQEQAGDETVNAWLEPDLTTCEVLTDAGEAGIIIMDFRAA